MIKNLIAWMPLMGLWYQVVSKSFSDRVKNVVKTLFRWFKKATCKKLGHFIIKNSNILLFLYFLRSDFLEFNFIKI